MGTKLTLVENYYFVKIKVLSHIASLEDFRVLLDTIMTALSCYTIPF